MRTEIELGIVALAMLPALAQTPAFEVASVRPYVYGVRGRAEVSCTNGHFLSFGFSIEETIQFAYDLKEYQRPKLPAWTGTREGYYDIEARAAAPVSEAECRLMVRTLLKDRFKMVARWETNVTPVYELVVAKNGPKMPKVADTDRTRGVLITLNGNQMQSLAAEPPRGLTMQELAERLTVFGAQRPVLDKTGLEGLYKVTLSFGITPDITPRGTATPSEYPDLFTAVQEQLGLKMQDAKDPVDVLIVDHMERPDAN
jgi:uncharacterized protein (TIGR03435 family)